MNALNLKSCIRCGGDLYEQSDQFGRYRACLQCGYHHYITAVDPFVGDPEITYYDPTKGQYVTRPQRMKLKRGSTDGKRS